MNKKYTETKLRENKKTKMQVIHPESLVSGQQYLHTKSLPSYSFGSKFAHS